MSRLSEARDTLHTALESVFPASEWRAHKYPPDQIASPCAWVDVPSIFTQTVGRAGTTVVSTWAIYLVVDGAESAAVGLLDEATADAWDYLDALPYVDATNANPRSIDIGGVNGRAMVITLNYTHMARTLCHPLLAESVP